MTYLGIVGSRSRNSEEDYRATYEAFKYLRYQYAPVMIVSGGCPKGGDRFAESIAKHAQVPILIYYAEWDKHGKSAGFKRNVVIANQSDILIACVAKDRTGGTEDTIKKFLNRFGKSEAEAIEEGRLILV